MSDEPVKPKRKRRTKAEMEAAREAEATRIVECVGSPPTSLAPKDDPREVAPVQELPKPKCSICCQEVASVHEVDFKLVVNSRSIEVPGLILCENCLCNLPDYLAGALHIAMDFPREQFKRKFKYPPFILSECVKLGRKV